MSLDVLGHWSLLPFCLGPSSLFLGLYTSPPLGKDRGCIGEEHRPSKALVLQKVTHFYSSGDVTGVLIYNSMGLYFLHVASAFLSQRTAAIQGP